jgi:16S rRNA (guanine1516-N2)-methyltransferase
LTTKVAIKNDEHSELPDSVKSLNLPLESEIERTEELLLIGWHEDKLALFSNQSGPVYVDFVEGKVAHRRQFGGGKKQPLARAIGLSSKVTPNVIDATAGFGRDSFVLASLGCEVMMIERSPIMAALLKDGLERAAKKPQIADIIARMSVINADAIVQLKKVKPVQVIYLDPMYPEKKKAAAVKKEMRLLQQLAGPDLDSVSLLEVALKKAIKRVTVKRPKGAPPIDGQRVNSEISSPNTRYDIYSLEAF